MFNKLHSKLIYFKKISGYLKSIDFWTIVGSVATVLGLVLAVLTYQSQNTSNLNNSISNIVPIDTLQQNNKFKKNKLIMGVVNAVDKYKYEKSYKPFIKYIANKAGFDEYGLKIVSYDSITKNLINNKIDIAVFSPYSYIEAKDNNPELELFALPLTHNRLFYHSVIAVLKESKINRIEDLNDKSFAYTHTLSTSGYNIPKKIITKNKVKFGKQKFSGGHTASIKMLKKKDVDAIGTYKENFIENKENLNDYRFIFKSQGIPNNAYVLSPSLNFDLKNKIKRIMYDAHKDLSTKKMFDNDLKITKWIKANDADYNGLRAVLNKSILKYKINFKIKTTNKLNSYFKDNDIIYYIENKILKSITETNRFWDVARDKLNASCGVKNIYLKIYHINNFFKIDLEIDGVPISFSEKNQTYKETDLETLLPKFILNTILNQFNITTSIYNDKKQKYWFLEYGKFYGLNIIDYNFILNLEDGTSVIIDNKTFNDDDLKNNIISLPKKYNDLYYKTKNISIIYNKKSP